MLNLKKAMLPTVLAIAMLAPVSAYAQGGLERVKAKGDKAKIVQQVKEKANAKVKAKLKAKIKAKIKAKANAK